MLLWDFGRKGDILKKCPDFPQKMSGILDPRIPRFRSSATSVRQCPPVATKILCVYFFQLLEVTDYFPCFQITFAINGSIAPKSAIIIILFFLLKNQLKLKEKYPSMFPEDIWKV